MIEFLKYLTSHMHIARKGMILIFMISQDYQFQSLYSLFNNKKKIILEAPGN